MDASGAPADETSPPPRDTFAEARSAFRQAAKVVQASLALLRAELRLARSSAVILIWLGFALVFLGVGAWLATSAAVAAGIYQLTGNVFYGVGAVALVNIIGVVVVLIAMRACARDLALPRTRRMLGRISEDDDENT